MINFYLLNSYKKRKIFILVKKVWFKFLSMQTGFILLGFIIITSLFGSFIHRGSIDPQEAKALQLIGYYNIYNTLWFRSLLILFCINVTFCCMTRLHMKIRNLTKLPGFYKKTLPIYTFNVSYDINIIQKKVIELLEVNQCNVVINDSNKLLYAFKGWYSFWGTLVLHLSLTIICMGALISNFFSYSTMIYVFVGEKYNYSNNSNWHLRVNKIQQGETNENISDVSIFYNNQEVKRNLIKVNFPMHINDVSIYQSYYGQAIKLTIWDETFSRALIFPERRLLVLEGTDLVYTVMKDLSGDFQYIFYQGKSEIARGRALAAEKIKINNLGTITFEEILPYVGFQIKKDPGVPIVWIGFFLLIVGFFTSFYQNHFQIWFKIEDLNNESKITIVCNKRAKKTIDRIIMMINKNTGE